MEANIEALKAKEIAEKRFAEKDFMGAKNYALKAKTLCPGLDGISQMVATYDVYVASEGKVNGATDYYSVLGLKPFADKDAVKKQYKQMAVLLHPDKNKTAGADGAFKLLSEAWTKLSDGSETGSCGKKRKKQTTSAVVQTNFSDLHNTVVTGYSNSNSTAHSHGRLDTFWTVCTSCKVQYEYLRKYVNKRLSCKNCRGVFIAVETGAAPVNGAFPYSPWPYGSNGHGSHIHDRVAYVSTSATCIPRNGFSGYHSGHGHEYASNISFEWNIYTTSTSVVSPNGPSSIPADAIYQGNGNIDTARAKVRSRSNGSQTTAYMGSNMFTACDKPSELGTQRPEKKRKVVAGADSRIGHDKREHKHASEATAANGNASDYVKRPIPTVISARRCSNAPAFDTRKLFIDKAKSDIQKKLEEMKLASDAAGAANKEISKANAVCGQPTQDADACHKLDLVFGSHIEKIKRKSVAITVPDSDFHDFDKDRAEECFKPRQIWALYDEDDGMPRLYCLIREVISINPFKIHINYLNSKTDTEFGTVNWLDSGFTKSCGHFRAWNHDIVDQVNIFSHLLGREKAGRGGCVRIFPRRGDIWAMYRNWSPDWNRSTPDEVRHQYEMVEVLDDYSEELGICVIPLSKVTGFKTVYQRNTNKDAIQRFPRREMVRFSHQVPSWPLKGEASNLPNGCWDLDTAAIPEELLNNEAEAEAEAEAQTEG